MSRALIYARCSTGEQAASGLGLEAQEAACRAAAARLGLEVSAVHADAGLSGTAPIDARPALLAAVEALEAGDVLIVAKRDRVGRDVVLVAVVERLVERKGARLVSAAGEGSDDEGPSGQLMRTIVDAFAQYERALICARTRAALAAKRRRGERAGAVPYGYQADATGRLHPLHREQEVLACLRAMREAGLSYGAIAARLTQAGTPARGSRWWPESVRSILATDMQRAVGAQQGRRA